jgi:hypothetical protein
VEGNGQIYTSEDSGSSWAAHGITSDWSAVAASSDGMKILAAVTNGLIYTSTIPTSTVGTLGSISGGQYDAIELQYIGNDKFTVLSHEGYLTVQ